MLSVAHPIFRFEQVVCSLQTLHRSRALLGGTEWWRAGDAAEMRATAADALAAMAGRCLNVAAMPDGVSEDLAKVLEKAL